MSVVQSVDNVALLPAYLAAGTAVLVLLADLQVGRAGATVAVACAGVVATGVGAVVVGAAGSRRTFCVGADCSWVFDGRAALVAGSSPCSPWVCSGSPGRCCAVARRPSVSTASCWPAR